MDYLGGPYINDKGLCKREEEGDNGRGRGGVSTEAEVGVTQAEVA